MAAKKSKARKKTTTRKRANPAPSSPQSAPAATGGSAREFLASNSIPIALVATGVGLLAARNINGGDNAATRVAANGKTKVAEIAATAGKKGKSLSQKAQNNGNSLKRNASVSLAKAQDTVRSNPVATGLTAFAIGAGLAVALPKLVERHKQS